MGDRIHSGYRRQDSAGRVAEAGYRRQDNEGRLGKAGIFAAEWVAVTGVLVEEPAKDPDDAEVHDQYDDLHDRVQDVQLALKKEEN